MAVLLIPGAFPVLLGYVAVRLVRRRRLTALRQSPGNSVPVRRVVATLTLRDLLREARATL